MSHGIDLQRFFRWVNGDRNRAASRAKEQRQFAPLADELEARRLLTLNVWIDDTNRVRVDADNDIAQYIFLNFDANTSTYQIEALGPASNFFIVSDTSVGLTVTKTDYAGVGNNPKLTIVENTQTVPAIFLSTGDSDDTVFVTNAKANVLVSTADGADRITHTLLSPNSNGPLNVDGGAGQDTVSINYDFAGSFNINQSIYGSTFDSNLIIQTEVGVILPTDFIHVGTEDVEVVQDFVTAPNSNITFNVNGINGNPNGGWLDRTVLSDLSIFPISLNKSVNLFGYESNDDIDIFQSTDGTNFIVGLTGPRLPNTNIFNMDPVLGILRLRTLGGDDVVKAAPGVEALTSISVDGGAGDDYISADATLIGGSGNDTLQGGAGNDSIDGGLGDDVIVLTGGTDTYVGGGGFDTLYMSGSGGADFSLSVTQNQGVPAQFSTNGVASTVTMNGIARISVQGSAGNDVLTVAGTSTTPVPIVAFMGAGADFVGTTGASAQHVVTGYGEAGQDAYDAGPGRDTFYGGDDSDSFNSTPGEENDDIFDGGSGENVLEAIGTDIFLLDIAGVLTLINGGTGSVSGYGVSRVSLLVNDPGTNPVRLQADAGDNTILVTDSTTNPTLPPGMVEISGLMVPVFVTGLTVGDQLTVAGNAGADSFTAKGSNGASVSFEGGAGMDSFHVLPTSTAATFDGNLGDVVSLSGTLGPDSVSLTPGFNSYALTLNGTTQTIFGAGRFVIETWSGSDEVILAADTDLDLTVDTGNDDDLIDLNGVDSAGANVRVYGGDGADSVFGPVSAQTVIYGGTGDDFVVLIGAATVFGEGGDDNLSGGDGGDSLDGGDGNDEITGGAGDDFISTGAGFNLVAGGLDNDVIVGGPDADQFYWFAGDGSDIVDGGGGGDSISAFGADGAANQFAVLRYGTGYEFVYNGSEGILTSAVPWIDMYAGLDSNAEGSVEDMSGISIERAAFFFDLAATSDVTVNGTLGDDNLLVASVPGFVGIVSIAGLSYQFRYLGEATGLATNLTVLGQDGDDTMKSTLISPTISTITFDGGTGNDFLSADATLIGGAGDDTLQGGTGDDVLIGNDGDDTFLISDGNDSFDGGAGFDIVRLVGATAAPNFFGVQQSNGMPVFVQVNATATNIDLTGIDLISVQGSTGQDFLLVTGDADVPFPILATLDLGNDITDTNQAALAQRTSVYGEGGDDYFISGPGTDYFYGGDDYDLFDAMYASRDSFDFFDGGTGFNDLYVEGSAFGDNVITAIPSGFLVTNTNGTGETRALNIGSVFVDSAGSGVILNASDDDDVIRTYDSTSDLTPTLPQNELLVTGMPGDIRIIGIEAGSFVVIHGQGGNDTFQSLGNADITIDFIGDSGDDRFVVTEESRAAFFTGGAGIDRVDVTTTLGNDTVVVAAAIPGESVSVNGVVIATVIAAEQLSIDMLAGNDSLLMTSVAPGIGMTDYDFSGGDGDDQITLSGFTAIPGSVFHVRGGTGNDGVLAVNVDNALLIAFGGSGNDSMQTSLRAELYGDEGDDTLIGSDLSDSISGGGGNDQIIGAGSRDFLYGDEGQDSFFWDSVDDGDDIVDGGTGQDALFVAPNDGVPDAFTLRANTFFHNLFDIVIAGNVIGGGAIEQVNLSGGSSTDSFTIDDLSQTSITDVNIRLGFDQVGDEVYVQGTTANDFVVISGSDETLINGLPWMIRVMGAQFSATTLVDGILFDGHLGEDTIITASNLTNPVLVTIHGGAGGDDIRINSPTLGDNTNRVTVDVSADVFADVIQLRNGRNRVVGGDLDVILVSGTENDDRIDIVPDGGGRIEISLAPPGFFSSNDLTAFSGVVHVEGLGGDDEIRMLAELRSTIWGGDGNDRIFVGPGGALAYGGSGNDQMTGGIGNDTFYGGAGNDDLIGDEGDDILYGEDGEDVLFGGLGLDLLYGGADADLLLPGKNGTLAPEFVDGGSGQDQIRFDFNSLAGIIGRTAGVLNVGEFGAVTAETAFNAVDAENLLVIVDSTVLGSTGFDLTVQDITGSQVNFIRTKFVDATDANNLTLDGTIAGDVIDADYVLPPGGEPNAQVLMPWGTLWAYKPASQLANDTLQIQGQAGDDVIKVSDALSQGGFGWNISLTGGSGNDFLSADATLVGGDGNDTLLGGTGDDLLEGNAGDDVFLISDGLDTFVGGAGFDSVQVIGATDAFNEYDIWQYAGNPTRIWVNSILHNLELAEIDQISVLGSTGTDIVSVAGDRVDTIPILAILGAGNDEVDANIAAISQVVTAYGEEGQDLFYSGPGTSFFYGGDDYDRFVVSRHSYDSANWFDGGSGFNELVVETPPTGTTAVSSIPSGFKVTNSDHTGQTLAWNIGNVVVDVIGGGGIVIDGSNNDDTIRTFDSTSDLLPTLPTGQLLIAGLGADITINGVLPNQVIDIHGEGGDDTFQSLGNAGAFVTFYGDSGDDSFVITEESRFATFAGGDGYDRTSLQGSAFSELIEILSTAPATITMVVDNNIVGDSRETEEFIVDAMGGSDEIRATIDQFLFNFLNFKFYGGAGNDIIDLNFGGGSFGHFTVEGGAGEDYLIGSTLANSQLLSGGLGNDRIETGSSALVFGDAGNDTLIGSPGNDTISGGDGDDEIVGDAGNDILSGDAGEDFLSGGDGFDALYGGADSDLLLPGTNDSVTPEIVDGGSGLDQVRFDFSGIAGLIGRTAGTVNVGDFGGTTLFNSTDVEDLLAEANTTVPGATGMDVTIQDLTGSQVNFVRVIFSDPNDRNQLIMQGTIANDTIDASYVLPPGGTPNAQVLMPWGTVWAFTQGALAPLNTLLIEGREGNDVIKTSPYLNEGAFSWNIVLQGDEGNDFLSADATLIGGAGNDTLQGGIGDDSLEGGDGDDVFLLSDGTDTFLGGLGFDIVQVVGSVNGPNLFEVDQSAGNPTDIKVSVDVHSVILSEIDQISVQGGSARDMLFVSGDSTDPISILAMLGDGDDLVDTAANLSAILHVTAWGEAGNDDFISGPGRDLFYGGSEYDIFVASANSFDSNDWFDGGTGFNELVVNIPAAGTTTITPIPSGFSVFNTDYTGSTIALNIGNLEINGGGGGGIVIDGSNNDDTIRTFDSTSDLVPPLAPATLLIAGLGADIYVNSVVPGQFIGIHGQGGNDTFQSLGNAQSNLNFFGDSGDDKFVVTRESVTARFTGGAGLDTVIVNGTEVNNALIFQDNGAGALSIGIDLTERGLVVQAESLIANGLGGGDRIEVISEAPATGIQRFELNGGDGADSIYLNGTKSAQYAIYGGGGNDTFVGPDGFAAVVVYAGEGNDSIFGNGASLEVYGEAGNDTIFGSAAADFISGGEGDDQIEGGTGNDQIFGDADQDRIYWIDGDGNDGIDGGTGQDSLFANGSPQAGNDFELQPEPGFPGWYSLRINAYRLSGGEIEFVGMSGGSGSDRFTIGDLSTTAITSVEANFGMDLVPDSLFVLGTMNNDTILLTGTDGKAAITGLPWLVQARNILADGNTLVDGISIDGHYGNDWLRSGIVSNSPMLVTLIGSQGSDLIEVNTIALGDNANRVTVIADGDVFVDRILLTNGRNLVIGSANDVIEITGTENKDTISVDGGVTPGRVVFDVNGQASSNDLTNFLGVMHIDGLGGDDVIYTRNYATSSSVLGGLGNDIIDSRTMNAPVSLYGGSGNDMLLGGAWDDYIDGGEGIDQLFGGRGNDRVEGGSGSDSIFYTAGEGQDLVDGGEGVNNLYVNGSSDSENLIVLYSDLFDPTAIDIDVNNISLAITAKSIQGIKLSGGNVADQFTVQNLAGTPLQSLIVDMGIDANFGDTVTFDGTIGNDTIGVGSDVLRDVLVTGLSYKARVTGFNFNPAAPVVDKIIVNGDAGYDTLFVNASMTAPAGVRLNGGIGNDLLYSEAPDLTNPGGRFRVMLDGGSGIDEFTVSQGSVYLVGSGADILHIDGNVLNNQMGIVMGLDVLNYTLDGSLIQYNVTDYSGTLSIDAQGGNDVVFLQAYGFASTVVGGLGNDRIDASGMNIPVYLYGGDGNDALYGGSSQDVIDGGAGNDTIQGNQGFDTIYGGDGSDLFSWYTGDNSDEVDGGTGDDRLVFIASGTDDQKVTLTPATSTTPSTANGIGMGNANMILAAMAGNGSVTAGSIESVLLEGGDGCDLFGIGNLQTTDVRVVDVQINNPEGHAVVSTYATNLPDTITVTADAPDQIGVNGLAVPVRIFGAVADATAIVVHAGFGGDTIEVDPQAEAQAIIVIDGGSGNDTITGGSIIIGGPGNNLLIGSDGPNTIVGGTGSDTIYGLGGNDTLFGDAEVLNIDILGPNCEYIGNLIILPTATGAPDSIFGGDGDDFINGNVGADSIYGGEGHDDIGAQTYNGVFFPEAGNDVIDAGEGDNCVFSGTGNDTVTAGNGNNRIVLDEGDDTATTGNGNNSIFGGAGNDTATTGEGNDLVALGAGDDKATLGSGNDIAWGEDGNDFIIGGYGNDSLYGGAGNDILWGGLKATQPLKKGQKHAPIEPSDGDDVLAGNDGFDQLDGGNSNNIMDAGADYIRETMVGSGGWDTAYIHKDEGKFQDVLKNHSKRYTLIPYGAMMIPVVPKTPTDCDSPILVSVPNPLAGALNSPPKKAAAPKPTVVKKLRGR